MELRYSDQEKMVLLRALTVMCKESVGNGDYIKAFKLDTIMDALENDQLTRNDLKYIQSLLVAVGGGLKGDDVSLRYAEVLLKTVAMLKEM